MNNRKQTISQRWLTGLVLLVVFVAFSGKILAQPGFVKKALYEQTTSDDTDEDLADDFNDFILPEPFGFTFSATDDSVYPVRAVHTSTIPGSRPPRWILNKQLKLDL
jgi:hypothetical protein